MLPITAIEEAFVAGPAIRNTNTAPGETPSLPLILQHQGVLAQHRTLQRGFQTEPTLTADGQPQKMVHCSDDARTGV